MEPKNYKENIRRFYNHEAQFRNNRPNKEDWKINVRKQFCDLLLNEHKKTLLELGAGAGYDSQFFAANGLTVTAVDLSPEMVKNCKEKSLEAYELDFYDISTLNKTFDSAYTINAFLHIPKNDLEYVLGEVNSILNPGGLFYLGLYGGNDTETEFIVPEISDAPRFYAFHTAEQLRKILEHQFEIISFESIKVDKGEIDIFHSVIMKKIV